MDIVNKTMLKDLALNAVNEFKTDLNGVSESFSNSEFNEGLGELGDLLTKIDQFGWKLRLAIVKLESPLAVPETPPAVGVNDRT